MQIKIYSIGRVKQKFVLSGEAEYLKRLTGHTKVELLELDSDRYSRLSEPELKAKEAELLFSRLKPDEYLVVLDERGDSVSSEKFSKLISSQMNRGVSSLSFAIGGACGWDESVRKRASKVLSFSQMTFPHQLIRLVLIEQIYRAFTIIRGLPYHK